MIQAVLFDLDDTLLWDRRSVDEALEATCLYASQKTGCDPVRLGAAVRREARNLYESWGTFPFVQRIGINPFEALWGEFRDEKPEEFRLLRDFAPAYRSEVWARALKSCGVDDVLLGRELGERFRTERRQRPYVFRETFSVLDALKTKYRLLLLTNGSPDLQREKLAGVPGLAEYFEYIVVSGDFGEGKPSVALFRHALKLLSVAPHECVMVGDKLTTDILGANRSGIASIWINREKDAVSKDIVPTVELPSLEPLPEMLDRWNETGVQLG